MTALMQTDLPEPVVPALRKVHFDPVWKDWDVALTETGK